MKGEWVWADIYGPCKETPRNPNRACFTRVWVPDVDHYEEPIDDEQQERNDQERAKRHARNQAVQLGEDPLYCKKYPPRQKANAGIDGLWWTTEELKVFFKVCFWGTLIGLLLWIS